MPIPLVRHKLTVARASANAVGATQWRLENAVYEDVLRILGLFAARCSTEKERPIYSSLGRDATRSSAS
jgi:hypothetical protein